MRFAAHLYHRLCERGLKMERMVGKSLVLAYAVIMHGAIVVSRVCLQKLPRDST